MSSRDVDYVGHEHLSESKRKSRNMSEKKRRDAFNTLVTELALLVTGVERRLDKSNVLRQTIAFLKKHNQLQAECATSEEIDESRPAFLSGDEYFRLLLDSLEAFLFVVDINNNGDTATICYISENATMRLGSNNVIDYLRGKSIFDFLDDEDESLVRDMFRCKINEASNKLGAATSTGFLRFKCKFRTCLIDEEALEMDFSITARVKTLDEESSSLICMCLAKPIRQGSFQNILTASITKEFSTRMNVEWKFIQIDSSVMHILGYLPIEMLGVSIYDYCHVDDLDKLMENHERLKTHNDGTTTPYRFRTKSEKYIWLRTRFYITYHEWNSKPEFIVCTNVVVNNHSQNQLSSNDELGQNKKNSQQSKVNWRSSDRNAISPNRSDIKPTQVEQNRQIFRPQPGVSIEHTPISRMAPISMPPAKKTKIANPVQQDESAQSIGQLNERMLWELLEKRQTNLQEKIIQHQHELKRLQEQLFNAVPLLSSSSPVSSNGTIEMEITSPASSSLSPAIPSLIRTNIMGTEWSSQQGQLYGNHIWASSNQGINTETQREFFDNGPRNTFL